MEERWIIVHGWEKFQHSDVLRNKDTIPGWIKVYTKLLHNPDFDRLTYLQRGLLLTIWVEYASSDGQLSVTDLSRRCHERVRVASLETLNHAGFISLSADRPSKQSASLEKRREENPPTPLSRNGRVFDCTHCPGGLTFKSKHRLEEHLRNVHDIEEVET